MPENEISYIEKLLNDREILDKEIKALEASLPSFRARYEDWAREAARTQAQKDIDTRNEAYAQWQLRDNTIKSKKETLANLDRLIESEIKKNVR